MKETKDNLGAASTMVAFALYRVAIENDMDLGNSPQEVFQAVFGNPQFRFTDDPADYGGEPGTTCFSTGEGFNCTTNFVKAFATQLGGHEFGHVSRGRIQARYLLEIPRNISEEDQEEIVRINEYRAGLFSPYNNLANSHLEYLDENGTRNADPYQEDTEEIKWQWHTTELYPNSNSPNTTNEIFGEMFLAWAFDAFTDNSVGTEFNEWMEGMMPTWMLHAAESYNDSWLED